MFFLELRREAIEWAEEDNDADAKSKVTVEEARGVAKANSAEEIKQMRSLLEDQRQLIKDQQSQINQQHPKYSKNNNCDY